MSVIDNKRMRYNKKPGENVPYGQTALDIPRTPPTVSTTRTPIKPYATKELGVITKAKDLCALVFEITEKAPKRFRFSLCAQLTKFGLSVIENVYQANECFVEVGSTDRERRVQRRRDYQAQASTDLKMLDYFLFLAVERGCILTKQYERAGRLIHECQLMLGGWIKSDNARFERVTNRTK